MINELTNEINVIRTIITDIPCGKVINKKTFPPSITELRRLTEKLIDIFIKIHNLDNTKISLPQIEELRSRGDNVL